ncbi:polymorphic toxin-type HINT domain-containing protein [Spirillospora sp. CA-253888]
MHVGRQGRRIALRHMPKVSVVVAAVLGVTLLPALPADATPKWRDQRPATQKMKSVPVNRVPAKAVAAGPADAAARRPLAKGAWPKPGSAVVDMAAAPTKKPAQTDPKQRTAPTVPKTKPKPAQAGSLPVTLTPLSTAGLRNSAPQDAPSRVKVEVLDRATTDRAGVPGVLVRLTALQKTAPENKTPQGAPSTQTPASTGPVEVRLDYKEFAHAYGGDYGSRLRLVTLPECALTTPDRKDCQTQIPVRGARNDAQAQQLVGQVGAGAAPVLLAAAPGASGPSGDYSATSLSPSAKWQVAAQSGSFSWNYPLRVPPALGGPSPELSLQYNSGGVDGRVASTNNQPSWVGEGFEMAPGFIERKYQSCTDDGHDDDDDDGKGAKSDQCWGTDNATMSFGGRAGELVKKSGNEWRLKTDDGTKIEHKFDGFNDDENKEYWVVTTTNGIRYYFGRGQRSATDTTKLNSAWTAPVFGDDEGEPCHDSTFASSFCNQAWRWNLDYVVDAHGNSMTYFYKTELNKYGRNENDKVDSYTRGGWLDHVDYGEREGEETATPPARVRFDVAERCFKSGTITCGDTELKKATKDNWPDVPYDRICTAKDENTPDPDAGDPDEAKGCKFVQGPAFFTRKMLSAVNTEVWDPAAKKYLPVDTWTLTHSFPDPGDGSSPALWLEKIAHTGKASGAGVQGGALDLPDVTFKRVQHANRVASVADSRLKLNKYRIQSVLSESGGQISVNYSDPSPECTPDKVKDAGAPSNTRLCYPAYWSPEGAQEPFRDWFHKYVVTSVVEDGRTGGGEAVETHYKYLDDPAWHYDTGELVKKKNRTWSQYRGFGRVQIRKGVPDKPQQVTEFTYLRGMHGDRLDKDAKERRDVKVTPTEGGPAGGVPDYDRWQGYQLEQITYNGNQEISGSVTIPWISEVTAEDSDDKAYLVGTAKTLNRTVLFDQAGKQTGVRRAQVTNTFDDYGMIDHSSDEGEVGKPDDETCTDYTYARNTGKGLLTLVSRVETLNKLCGDGGIERPKNVISDVKTTYNGVGDATKTEKMKEYDGSTPKYIATATVGYDKYGRVTSSTDAQDNTTTTAYIPAAGGPVTGMSVTNPLGHKVTSTVQPAWGLVTGSVDANNKKTTLAYDALGRRTKVWLPGRATTASPNLAYDYLIRQNDPVVITTRKLKPNGNTDVSYELMDGLLRKRQSQSAGAGAAGGRVMSETRYDSRGLVVQENGPFWNKDAPGTSLMTVSEGDLPTQSRNEYDAAGRLIAQAFRAYANEQWRVTTTYAGDRIHVDPPKGTTPTTTVTNVQGQTAELWQYKGSAPVGEHDTTRYTYNKGGQISTVTDAMNNVWTYEYDALGRLGKTKDPDKGESTIFYNDLGQITSTHDAEGRALYYSYDNLGRKTQLRKDAIDGTLLASWAYDTIAKGQAASSTRYVGGEKGAKYVQAVTGYDDGYRPLGATVTIPSVAGEEALAKSYSVTSSYNVDGSLASSKLPAAGGLPEETIRTGYDASGLPVFTKGASTYVMESKYSNFAEPSQYTLGLSGSDKWMSLTYSYEDSTRRLSEARVDREGTGGTAPDSRVSYKYDETGNPLRIADTPDGKASTQHDVQCFQYDYLRRLSEAWAQQSGACAAKPSQAAIGGIAPYWESFTYHPNGSRDTQTIHSPAGDTKRTYAYPKAGGAQPHTLTGITQTGPGGTSAETYAYDKTGNTKTRKLAGWNSTLTWDSEGRLEKLADPSKGDTSFLNDTGGNRLLRRDQSSVTLYLGATELRLDKKTKQVTGTRYYIHNGKTVAVRNSTGKVTFLAGDHHGTNDIAIDAQTMAVSQRRFLPFGNPRGTVPGNWATDKGFVGGTLDLSMGLTHLGAREYDAATGRFISVDPVVDHSDPQQMHGYAYSYNNPLAFIDATGLWSWSDLGHLGLDVVGYVPVVGEAADVVNGVWYAAEGNYVDASLSFSSAIPIAGYAASVAKGVKTAAKAAEGADTAATVAKTAGNATDAGKAIDNATPPAAPKPNKPPENPAPAKPKEQPKSQGKADDGASPSGSKQGASRGGGNAKNRGESDSGGGGCSFVPDTRVELADGTHKPINEIKLGDLVTAEEPISGKKGNRRVVATIVREAEKTLVEVTVDEGNGKSGKLTATDNHPFWVAEVTPERSHRPNWREARDLHPGTWLKTSAGTWVQVVKARSWTARQRVHNLSIDEFHTYHVAAGDADVLVHNVVAGPCAVTGGPYRGAQHKDLLAKKNVTERNHMPASQAITKVFGIPEGQGLAIQMDKLDHHATESWGSGYAGKLHRHHQMFLLRNGRLDEAIQMDIDNIRNLFGSKYDAAINEMLGYRPQLLSAIAKAGQYRGPSIV